MKLTKIKLNPNNPRKIKDEKFEKLKKSIKDFPKMMELRPMVINSDNIVLGGNMRLKALKELGYEEVPEEWVKRAEYLTEDEQREFIIKDNVGFGEHDWQILETEWDADELSDWGLDMPADWKEEVLEAEEDDFDTTPPEEPKTVLGDLYEIGEHRLLCGSSTEVDNWENIMIGQLADLVVTDPPYKVDYTGSTKEKLKIQNDKFNDSDFYQFLYDFYSALGAYSKKGASWYVWHADSEGSNFRQAMKDAGIMVKQCLIWIKNSMVMGRQDYQWKHEPCLYGWKEGAAHAWYSDRKQTTVLEFDRPNRNAEHPTMKPIELISYQITNSSKIGDLVSDGFLGSGTTMVAAHQLKRKCYGMELDAKYCDVIIKRMIALDDTLTVKRNGKDVTSEWK